MLRWFKNLFVSFQVNRVGQVEDLKVAHDKGYHAVMWGHLVDPLTMYRGPEMLMALGSTKQQALFGKPRPQTIQKIQRFMQGMNFIPTSHLIVFKGETWSEFEVHEVRTLLQRDVQRAEESHAADMLFIKEKREDECLYGFQVAG